MDSRIPVSSMNMMAYFVFESCDIWYERLQIFFLEGKLCVGCFYSTSKINMNEYFRDS